ncbi:MAG: 50S ribosomal protein L17 [Kiritimatiellaeota bacterium]|nr:50S ribosomal protein L17 [Kiritimatiellota bacterium]
MRHKMVSTTFGRSSAHRRAMLAQLVCCLIEEKRIETTLSRAKAARSLAEKMVTLARSGTLTARRRAIAILRRPPLVKALFEQIAPQCQDRSGGYTRIIKRGARQGDNAPVAILEWVSIAPVDKKKKKPVSKTDEKKPTTKVE